MNPLLILTNTVKIKKTSAEFFKDLVEGDIIHLSIDLKNVGCASSGNYATNVKYRLNDSRLVSQNNLVRVLRYFELSEHNTN